MRDGEREAGAPGSDSPMTRVFRQLADAAEARDGTDRIVDLAGQFDAASDPPEDSEPPPPPR